MSTPAASAVARIFAAGPTRIGTMMPACAASTAPLSALASHGWATAQAIGGIASLRRISSS